MTMNITNSDNALYLVTRCLIFYPFWLFVYELFSYSMCLDFSIMVFSSYFRVSHAPRTAHGVCASYSSSRISLFLYYVLFSGFGCLSIVPFFCLFQNPEADRVVTTLLTRGKSGFENDISKSDVEVLVIKTPRFPDVLARRPRVKDLRGLNLTTKLNFFASPYMLNRHNQSPSV